VNYINEQHHELAQSQQSGLIARFATMPMDRKMGAIALSGIIGLTCGAMTWTGKASERVYFCLERPDYSLQCQDANNRYYRMTPYHWQQWKDSGMPSQIVPNPAVGSPDGVVPATNPHKPFWAFGAFVGFAATGYMLRHLQSEESRLATLDAIAQRRDEAVADMKARAAVVEAYQEVAIKQAELEAAVQLVEQDALFQLQQVDLFSEAELEVARLETEDAKFEAQTAGMTEEQRQEYIEFLRNAKTPYLMNGITLDQVNHPGDKVGAANSTGGAIASAPEDEELFFEIHRINPPNPTQGKNLIIIAEQGVGKTTLAKWLAGEVLQSEDIQVYDLDDDRKTWGNLPVWGTGDDETEIAGAMQADMDLFDQRTKDRVAGRKFGLSARIVDENPAVYDAIPKKHEEWTFKMGSRARKRGFVVILLTQERDPAANGLTSNRLRNYNQVFLGRKQVNHALSYLVKPKPVADRLRPLVDGCQRPALVEFNGDWFYWEVPDLKEWEAQFNERTKQKINPASDTQLGIKVEPEAPKFPPVTPETMGDDVRQRLEFLFDFSTPKPPAELPPEALAIIAFSQRKGEVSTRDCLGGIKLLRGKSAEDVKQFFLLIQQAGRGKVSSDGGSIFCPVPEI
jgi:hypothetical protein